MTHKHLILKPFDTIVLCCLRDFIGSISVASGYVLSESFTSDSFPSHSSIPFPKHNNSMLPLQHAKTLRYHSAVMFAGFQGLNIGDSMVYSLVYLYVWCFFPVNSETHQQYDPTTKILPKPLRYPSAVMFKGLVR